MLDWWRWKNCLRSLGGGWDEAYIEIQTKGRSLRTALLPQIQRRSYCSQEERGSLFQPLVPLDDKTSPPDPLSRASVPARLHLSQASHLNKSTSCLSKKNYRRPSWCGRKLLCLRKTPIPLVSEVLCVSKGRKSEFFLHRLVSGVGREIRSQN